MCITFANLIYIRIVRIQIIIIHSLRDYNNGS